MYTDKERQIFGPYDLGDGRQVYGDPFRLNRQLVHLLDGSPGTVLRALKSAEEPVRFEATEKIVDAARQVFGLVPFNPADGSGALDTDALALARRFIEWVDAVKKNSATTPTSPPPTDSPASSPCP